MNTRTVATCITLVLFTIAGCASSEITQRQDTPDVDQVAKPDRIIVYDVAATPADIPASASITGYYDKRETPQTAEEIELGRKLGAKAAAHLTARIREMGLTAERAGDGPVPDIGDAMIVGQFFSIDEGSRGKRVVIGFGAGSGELYVAVDGYLVTEIGHRQLGHREVATSGSKMPGVALPVAFQNPVLLAANSAMKLRGEKGAATLDAAAERVADLVADELQEVFTTNGWITND